MVALVLLAPDFQGHLDRAVGGFFADTLGPAIRDDARQVVPVDTGRLRSSLTSDVVGTTLRVGSMETPDVQSAPPDYSVYVELGTSRMAAQPYLQPSLFKARP